MPRGVKRQQEHRGGNAVHDVERQRGGVHQRELQRILRRYPGTFASFSPVSEVYGKFLK